MIDKSILDYLYSLGMYSKPAEFSYSIISNNLCSSTMSKNILPSCSKNVIFLSYEYNMKCRLYYFLLHCLFGTKFEVFQDVLITLLNFFISFTTVSESP